MVTFVKTAQGLQGVRYILLFSLLCFCSQGGQGQMSGIAALAAAAAATSKMNTVGVSSAAGTPSSAGAIKVVTPTIVKPAGIKVTPMPGRQGQRSECFVGVQVLVYRSGVFEYMYLVSRALDN